MKRIINILFWTALILFFIYRHIYNLTQMMYEGLLKDQSVSIGYTFIKKISPGQKFTYIVSQTNKRSNIYQNRIR